MEDIWMVKLGGSLITDKNTPFTPRLEVIRRLAMEIHLALEAIEEDQPIILGHGSGSFGHAVAQEYGMMDGVVDHYSWFGYVETGAAAAQLNRLVVDEMLDAGVPVVGFQPSASARCFLGELTHMATYPISIVLSMGMLPVVFGDVSVDDLQGFTIISTEQIFSYMADALPDDIAEWDKGIDVSRIILAGITDGVYDSDPLENPSARRFEEITPGNWEHVRSCLGGSHSTDVTGGMLSKVEYMYELVAKHPYIEVQIISGEVPGRLQAALLGERGDWGTVIRA